MKDWLPLDCPPVRLREFRAEDVEALVGILGDPQVTAHLSFPALAKEEVEVYLAGIIQRAQAEPRMEYYLAVTLPPCDEVVGMVRLGDRPHPPGWELGFAIARRCWGKGYATAAAAALTGFGFERLGLDSIRAATDPSNNPARRVTQRLGLQPVGIAPNYVVKQGRGLPRMLHVLQRPKWQAARQAGLSPAAGR